MLTVRQIQASGEEQVFLAKSIRYQDNRSEADSPVPKAWLDVFTESGSEASFETGKIFVMNDRGKTVATYDLDAGNGRGQSINPMVVQNLLSATGGLPPSSSA